jgi:isocitrate dehydrogenase (NAD+)
MLIDTTFALLMKTGGESLVIPALNRDGDLLSDLVLQMFGTVAGSESLILAFAEDTSEVEVVVAESPHGTAPSLQGKNIANPVAMILATAALLRYVKSATAELASRAIYESIYESIYEGDSTIDLDGSLNTIEVTDSIIRRVREKLEVWEHLGK